MEPPAFTSWITTEEIGDPLWMFPVYLAAVLWGSLPVLLLAYAGMGLISPT